MQVFVFCKLCIQVLILNREEPFILNLIGRACTYPLHQSVAEVARYLTSGLAYVQDERYAAGAGMRGSGQVLWWAPGGFASHIPVLNREVPFILNITPSALCESIG